MSLTDAAYIKVVASWMKPIDDADFAEHIVAAELRLRDWVGDSNYGAAESEGNTTLRGKRLKLAEAYLTIANMIPSVNIVFAENGITLQTTTGDGNVTYLSPAQIIKLAGDYVQKADMNASGYLVTLGMVKSVGADPNDEDRYL
jgi:hypothetical protein